MVETDGPNKVVQSTREVIERKLLAALGDESTVAILATQADLDLLIRALRHVPTRGQDEHERAAFWLKGIQQLYRAAFGK